jgi:UDP-N-acetylmuramate--alanine ligase
MKIHFVGIGGIGMSALAQLHAMAGDEVSGSDRLLDKGYSNLPMWDKLSALNIQLYGQNAAGIHKGLDCVVLSSAIETDNPDLSKAKEYGLKIIHRSELLASHVNKYKTVAVSGTSGKSTVTAMIYEILQFAGKSPSLITGGPVLSLVEKGFVGNVAKGSSDILVIEADESDGSFVNYHPRAAILLNITKDHKEMDVLYGYFDKFRKNCANFIINADEKNLARYAEGAHSFGLEKGDIRAVNIRLDGFSGRFSIAGTEFKIPLPDLYNVQNATAAGAVCKSLDVDLETCARALAGFKGVARRFNSVGSYKGIEVIDDFAHNPAKISAALSAAHLRGKRVLAVYQPHGYAPVKLLKNELVEAFEKSLSADDIIWFPEIYYVGGTVERDISSAYLAGELVKRGRDARFIACREEIIADLAAAAQPGDVVMVMGARDPTITAYAKLVLNVLEKGRDGYSCSKCLLNTKAILTA